MEHEIICEHREAVLLVRFNRPRTLNAFRSENYLALREILLRFQADPERRALVVTGAGRAFCSGHDLGEGESHSGLNRAAQRERLEVLQDITRLLRAVPKPTIAAINGPAVGFGAEMPLACDFRFADPSAYFMFPELARGLFFTNATLELLPRLVGTTRATMLLLAGERLDAAAAAAAGLVSRVSAPGGVVVEALGLAATLEGYAPAALAATLAALRARGAAATDRALATETEATLNLLGDSAAGHRT